MFEKIAYKKEIFLDIEYIKQHLCSSSIFKFGSSMRTVFSAFDTYILKFYKLDWLIITLVGLLVVLSVGYYISTFLVYKRIRKEAISLTMSMFEIDRQEIESYLQRTQSFRNSMKSLLADKKADEEEYNINFSSEDEFDNFEKQLNERNRKILYKNKQDSLQIRSLTRPFQQGEAGKRAQVQSWNQMFRDFIVDSLYDYGLCFRCPNHDGFSK
jgi:hypothetical protein